MRALVAVLVALLFMVPVPALGQPADDGVGERPILHVDVPGSPAHDGIVMTEKVSLDLQSPVVLSGLGPTSVLMGDLPLLNIPGLPRVPFLPLTIELPADAEVEGIAVDHDRPTTVHMADEIEMGVPMAPAGPKGPIPDSQVQLFYDGETFPADWLAYDTGRGLNADGKPTVFVNMFVYPVRYDGAEGSDPSMTYIDQVDLEIVYYLSSDVDSPSSSRDAGEDSRTESYDMIIIGPQGFRDNLQDLADHKNITGLRTRFVTLNEILMGSIFPVEGRDDQEKMKYFIKDAIEEWGIDYVLLGGDVDKVPTRYVQIYDGADDDGSQGVDGAWVPSDIYFGDVYGP